VGGKYSDQWQSTHLYNPRDLVPESIMPAYPWLAKRNVDVASIPVHMKALRTIGVPYTDAEIAAAADDVKDKTEMEAVVAYLQSLGLHGPH
jgi:cytochrome c oxidase cbb3-type subunit 2